LLCVSSPSELEAFDMPQSDQSSRGILRSVSFREVDKQNNLSHLSNLRDADGDGDMDFKDAAILAEQSLDPAETETQAWTHAIFRLSRMALGFTIFIVGIILLPAPGPGGLVVAAGLAILARDVAWADQLLRYLRKRMPGMAEEGPIPKSTIIASVMVATAAFLTFWWAQQQSWWWF